MTVTHPSSSTSFLHHRLVRVLRRWATGRRHGPGALDAASRSHTRRCHH